jgi:hypothetical protein
MSSIPAHGTLHFALLHAAASIDGDVDSLHTALGQTAGASEPVLLPMLQAARNILKRPVWVWTSLQPPQVFQYCYNEEESDPAQVTPIRICQVGQFIFALACTDDGNEATVELTPVAAGASADLPASVEHTAFPNLKEDVNRGLADVLSQIDDLPD